MWHETSFDLTRAVDKEHAAPRGRDTGHIGICHRRFEKRIFATTEGSVRRSRCGGFGQERLRPIVFGARARANEPPSTRIRKRP